MKGTRGIADSPGPFEAPNHQHWLSVESISTAERIARRMSDVCTSSTSRPSAASSLPASRASEIPTSVRSTSTQPVKRLARFHSDCPCRTRMRRACGSSKDARGGRCTRGARPGDARRRRGEGTSPQTPRTHSMPEVRRCVERGRSERQVGDLTKTARAMTAPTKQIKPTSRQDLPQPVGRDLHRVRCSAPSFGRTRQPKRKWTSWTSATSRTR